MAIPISPRTSESIILEERPTEIPIIAPSRTAPGFHVLTLNSTQRYDGSTWTYFRFTYDSTFHEMFAAYHGSLVLLFANCSGPNGTMTIIEAKEGGDVHSLASFIYHGESLVPIYGWHSESWLGGDLILETWGGSENLTMDWRNGTWNITDGIMVFHQAGQALGSAEMSLLYVVPEPAFVLPFGGTGGRRCRG